jgi:hypothetical protein
MALDDDALYPVRGYDDVYGDHVDTELGGGANATLTDAVTVYRKWLHLPDPGRLLVPLGVVAANLGQSDPTWLLEVAASSSGKTEVLGPLARLPYVHPVGALTEAALLSGTPKKEHEAHATGGVLREVGDFGIILCRDFSAILALRHEQRAPVLAALREIYDGAWARAVGTAGGRRLEWSGKCGFIGAVTPNIDRHHAVMGALGERFLLNRPVTNDRMEMGRRRLKNTNHEAVMRDEMADAIGSVLDNVNGDHFDFSDSEGEWLVTVATFVAAARTAVEREAYSHEVEAMPEPEAPGRLVGSLANLTNGLRAIGAGEDDVWRLVGDVAWGWVPEVRRRLLRVIRERTGGLIAELSTATGVPRATAERALEDLHLLGLLSRWKETSERTTAWYYALNPDGDAWPDAHPVPTHSLITRNL